ncbi:hypothetical protein C4D60_Mb04t03420 [Musa balbisiana]|uniref:Uncharacterized protein n=1 Tax=Musa balbisiana TaxID=52838 RepID=A0A4S8K9C7_MUSBA|nr:hypothetical protein C4D60_Mb04t03420 [Musa balbisiana]
MGGADERVKLGAVEGGGGRGDGIGGCGSERIEVDIEGGVKEGVVGVVGKGGKVVPFGKEPGGTVPVVGGGEVVVMLVVGVAAAAASPGKEGEVAGSGRSGGGCGAGAEVAVEDGGGLVDETGRKGVVVSVGVGRRVKEGWSVTADSEQRLGGSSTGGPTHPPSSGGCAVPSSFIMSPHF